MRSTGRNLLTLNLHMAVAHLPQQMRECGSAALMTEGHVEHEMHAYKAPLRDRRAFNLEAVAARRDCDQAAVTCRRGVRPKLWPPTGERRSMEGPDYGACGDSVSTHLLHKVWRWLASRLSRHWSRRCAACGSGSGASRFPRRRCGC